MDETILKNVFDSLDIMWKGMLGMFIVCGSIACIMAIIAKCVKGKK
ncbi:MAG: hypothetical protein LBV68_00705 [Spirochaetaceae bacterium]|jgi:hypothetical protein|nr:hypothetical protein [Spirochaetaceae bacterium]